MSQEDVDGLLAFLGRTCRKPGGAALVAVAAAGVVLFLAKAWDWAVALLEAFG